MQLTGGKQLIYSVAFSFFQVGQQPAVGIGAIQGPQGKDGLHHIRDATRNLHGLHPKNLLVLLVGYDTVWKEMGAWSRTNGDFQLGCEDFPAPVMENIQSKKRSEVRKQHETLQLVIGGLHQTMSATHGAKYVAKAYL